MKRQLETTGYSSSKLHIYFTILIFRWLVYIISSQTFCYRICTSFSFIWLKNSVISGSTIFRYDIVAAYDFILLIEVKSSRVTFEQLLTQLPTSRCAS